MKKYFFCYIIALILPLLSSFEAKGVGAYPYPIIVKQPDGSSLTIRIYGDEFLNWTVSGNRMVELGKDGFYYYASFSSNGEKIISNSRVGANSFSMTSFQEGNVITPPATAIAKALSTRKQMKAPSSSISIGEKPFLVLLIEFADLQFTIENPAASFSDLLNLPGYSKNNATGSVNDYFSDNSKGQFEPLFDVVGPIKVSQGYSYYSNNDGQESPGARELLVEACQQIDENVDFSKYDNDNDGYIDNVFFYFPGHNAAEGANDRIWPHKWSVLSIGTYTFDGKILADYACSSEYKGSSGTQMCGIGTFCHEFGHVIGLPDFYDTNYEDNGSGAGLGNFSLMSGGNYNHQGITPPYLNYIEKKILGWVGDPIELKDFGEYNLEPIENDIAYFSSTKNDGEYFLYENRQANGWDKYIGAHGMVIYHIDQSNNMVNGYTAGQRWEWGYGINDMANHQCFDIVEAVFPENNATTDSTPFPGTTKNTTFSYESSPSLKQWNELATGYSILNITESNQIITFTYAADQNVYLNGSVITLEQEPIKDAKVTITKLSENNSPIATRSGSMLSVKYKSTNDVITTHTDIYGKFTIKLESPGPYSINYSANGFFDYSKTYVFSQGGNSVGRIKLLTPSDCLDTELKKHSERFTFIGSSYDGPYSISCAVGFTKEELTHLVGNTIETITYQVDEQCGDAKVDVHVLFDGVLVFSQEVDHPYGGSPKTVNIKEANITIPEDTEVWIGYSIYDSPYSYPIACDRGPAEELGFLVKEKDGDWYKLYEYPDFDYNVCVSATLLNEKGLFNILGLNTIVSNKDFYSNGDLFELKLTQSTKKPSSVQWFFDEVEKDDGESIKLTAGDHIVKAVLKYSNGAEEVLIQEIEVK